MPKPKKHPKGVVNFDRVCKNPSAKSMWVEGFGGGTSGYRITIEKINRKQVYNDKELDGRCDESCQDAIAILAKALSTSNPKKKSKEKNKSVRRKGKKG